MTAKGYKGIMIREEVAGKFRAKAKAEGKTLTAFLNELLETYDKDVPLLDLSNKSILKIGSDIRGIIHEELEEFVRR